MYGDSRCFSCQKKLQPHELLPILSFIFLKGTCGHCGSKISWQYPIVEIVTGFLAVVIYPVPYALFYFLAFSLLLLLALYDFKNKIIDSHFLYIFGAFAVAEAIRSWILGERFLFRDTFSSFFIAFFFYAMWRFSKGTWMGRGDSNLVFFLALFLGFPQSIAMLFLSFWIGAVVGIILLLTRRRRFTIKSEIPFGPFLAIATFMVWGFSDFFNAIYHVYFFS